MFFQPASIRFLASTEFGFGGQAPLGQVREGPAPRLAGKLTALLLLKVSVPSSLFTSEGHTDFCLCRSKDLFSVCYLVVDRLGGSEERIVRPFAEQIIGKPKLIENVARGRTWLNLDVSDLTGAGHYNGKFLHNSFSFVVVDGEYLMKPCGTSSLT
jgi:hypothetical protein